MKSYLELKALIEASTESYFNFPGWFHWNRWILCVENQTQSDGTVIQKHFAQKWKDAEGIQCLRYYEDDNELVHGMITPDIRTIPGQKNKQEFLNWGRLQDWQVRELASELF